MIYSHFPFTYLLKEPSIKNNDYSLRKAYKNVSLVSMLINALTCGNSSIPS